MLIVQKYGGSSLATAEKIHNVAKRIIERKKDKNRIVVVLSAMGDTTDELIELANQVNPEASSRELDMLLSTGEQQSCALMAMALNSHSCSAISLNAFQANIFTTSKHSNAKIKKIDYNRINTELEKENVVIITGFQGYNKYDDVTTLGRGGSDTTAVAIAAAMGADLCEIYTDVDGIYTADPRIVKNAKKLDSITYDEMLELASLGAKVLHSRSVELAKKYNIELVVRSSITNAEGTIVKEDVGVEKSIVSGITVDKEVARIAVCGVEDRPGVAFRIFDIVAKEKISIDLILQSIGRGNTKDISFIVSKNNFPTALKALNDNKGKLRAESIVYDDNIAKVSIVGAGIATNSGVAALMFEALFDANINISMISTSEIKISALIDKEYADAAVIAIHDKFSLAERG